MHASGTVEYAVMSKYELIGRIREVNRSARPDFLATFSEDDLTDYLRRLKGVDLVAEIVEQPLLFE
jgi:hypothetical protein